MACPATTFPAFTWTKTAILWVGTSGHGLARFHEGKWTRYSTRDGLASNSISYIIEDDEGDLWIGSNAGIDANSKKIAERFRPRERRIFLSCRTYGEADGLPTRECSSGSQPAACRTRRRPIVVSHHQRPGVCESGGAQTQSAAAAGHDRIRAGGRPGAKNQPPRFGLAASPSSIPPGHDQLEIHYTGLNFSAPDEVRFKYRLEGHETAWTEAGDTRVAYYNKLPPGDYHFQVDCLQ